MWYDTETYLWSAESTNFLQKFPVKPDNNDNESEEGGLSVGFISELLVLQRQQQIIRQNPRVSKCACAVHAQTSMLSMLLCIQVSLRCNTINILVVAKSSQSLREACASLLQRERGHCSTPRSRSRKILTTSVSLRALTIFHQSLRQH